MQNKKQYQSNNDRRYLGLQKGKEEKKYKTKKETFRAMPIEFIPNHKMSFKRRFACSTGISGNLSIYDLLNTVMVATTTVLANSLLVGIRLKKLEIWTPVTINGTAVFVQIRPYGNDASSNCFADLGITISDTSQTLDRMAYVCYKTKKTLPSGAWHRPIAVDQALINIVCAAGSVMDLELEGVLAASVASGTYTRVLTAATAGTILAAAVIGSFVPIGVNFN